MPSTDEGADRPPGTLSLDEAFAYAQSRHKQGFVAEAAAIYGRILEASPGHVNALHFLGVAAFQLGKPREAIELIEKALALEPGYVDAQNNLGNVLQREGEIARARTCYERVLAARPDSPEALNNLGVILRAERRLEEAHAVFERVIALSPEHFEVHHNLGNVLLCMDRDAEALDAFRSALMLRPYDRNSYRQLGAAYYATGRVPEATEVYRRWLDLEPDDPEARHMFSACSGQDVPARTSNEAIKVVFDNFARSFDAVLHRLEYQAPALVADALRKTLGAGGGSLAVLDAGCGTGLAGALIRPYARSLVGVDLSDRMIAAAAERGCYDEFFIADVAAHAGRHADTYDLITAIDTLVYFGDLAPVLSSFRTALRPSGHVVFTVERSTDAEAPSGYRIHPHGRYSHTERYVRNVIAGCGLSSVRVEGGVLRKEARNPVGGFVVVARRPEG